MVALWCCSSDSPGGPTGDAAAADHAVGTDLAQGDEDSTVPDGPLPDSPLPSCHDNIKNAAETDVDCGGPSCPPCPPGNGCKAGPDCASKVCKGGKCASPSCFDKKKNGAETDTDCGGPGCAGCANKQQCKKGTDCKSGICKGGVCAAPGCTDKVKNGTETDTDCGGPDCPGCATGEQCKSGGDCASKVCKGSKCATATCFDKIKNGSETDTDCGGACKACANGKQCKSGSDCASKVCLGGKCAVASCTDKVKNGNETDVDCGGGCTGCADGKQCKKESDCSGLVCLSGKCSTDTFKVRSLYYANSFVDSPYPSDKPTYDSKGKMTNARSVCWGRAGFALAAYYTNRKVKVADSYMVDLTKNKEFKISGTSVPCYWAHPLLWRVYLHPTCKARMSKAARKSIEDYMWSYIDGHSKCSHSWGKTWIIAGSENHDTMQKSAYLLAAQALRALPAPYGGSRKLADKYTISNHFTGWQKHWKEYFRQRAREGINCEVASPIYAKYTLQAYYNIRDFAHSAILRSLADKFLHLYWADVSQEYLAATNLRGGAATRSYQDNYSFKGTHNCLRPYHYLYAWTDTKPGGKHPPLMVPVTSTYRVPKVISNMATASKSPYQYISRRFGLQGASHAEGYNVVFEGGNSHVRRFSYITKDYVLGTMTFHPAKNYNALLGQNRLMGVIFADNVNARILVLGNGTHSSNRTGYSEITGTTAGNCMIVQRDPKANKSKGTRVFVSAGSLWTNYKAHSSGWRFTRAGGAYVGVRLASGTTTTSSVSQGKMLNLTDTWSPVVIQLGQASSYKSYAAFQTSVAANAFSYKSKKLTYKAESGAVFEVWEKNTTLPRINGKTPSLNPAKTYSSPYILGYHGKDEIKIVYGKDKLLLNFKY